MVTFAEGFGEYKVFFDVTCELYSPEDLTM